MRSHLLTFLTIFLLHTWTRGQDQLSITYTIKNGLPSNTVYAVKKDSKGYLWITTDKGVVKYDGRKFRLFTIKDGLASNDNFSMLIDSKDNVWLYSFKAISRIDSKNRVEIFGDTKSYFSYFMMNKQDEIFYSLNDSIYSKKFGNNFSYFRIKGNNIVELDCPKFYYEVDRNWGYSFFNHDTFNVLLFDNIDGSINQNLKLNGNSLSLTPSSFINLEEYVLVGKDITNIEHFEFKNTVDILLSNSSYKLLLNNNKTYQKNYPNNLKKVSYGNIYFTENQLFVIFDKGIYRYSYDKNGNDFWEKILNLPKATSMVQDNEGNVWVSTLGNGLIKYICNSDIGGIGKSKKIPIDDVVKIAGYKDKKIWMATNKNKVKELLSRKELMSSQLIDLRFLECDEKDVFFGGSNALYKNSQVIVNLGFKNISLYKDSLASVATHGINFLVKNNPKFLKGFFSHHAVDILGRMYAILLSKNIFYSGNQQGLYWGHPKKNELIPICLDDNVESVSVNGIRESSNGLIWVATEGNGVYILKDKRPIRHLDKELLDANIISMRIDDKDNIWLASSKGLNKISYNNGNFLVKSYTTYHGLPSNYVHDTYCYNDELYIATDEGLIKMDVKDLDKLDNSIAPPVYIQSAMVLEPSHKLLNIDSTVYLQFNQNSIYFEYTGISYRSNGNVAFEYRLLPSTTSWQTTKNDNITFTDLRPGNYKFEVRAVNSIGTKSDKPAAFAFSIEKHFTQQLWFILTSLATGIFLISFIAMQFAKYRRNQAIAQNETERLIAELKLKSLQAQMNPHFIFNSLNAIQGFINGRNEKAANDYLVRFAQLIRLYLTSSESKFITLKQEMKVVEVYIELEFLRFSDKFQYKIDIDKTVDLEQYIIPAMLIQPHVENAIRHGLIPSGHYDNNLLEVSVLTINGGVQCIVKDNGIGRTRSHQIKGEAAKEHLSLGSKIARERLDAIKELNLTNITQRVSDIVVDGNICGTIVEITILETP